MENGRCSFIARKTEDGREQTIKEHLTDVACLARKFCIDMPWSEWAYAAGLLHDVGKCKDEFQEYIKLENEEKKRKKRGTIDHATAGAEEAIGQYREQVGKLLAYAIAGHHAGLANGKDNERSCLEWRLSEKNTKIGDYSAYKSETAEFPELNNTDIEWLIRSGNHKGTAFAISFFIRMLFSCLVDADRLDAEWFDIPEKENIRKSYSSLLELKEKLDAYLTKYSEYTGLINEKRAEVLKACRNKAEEPIGLYSLTVPTGGGKTLSSMAFALNHAIKHGMKRVIYVIPFTSIIEQNADVFRDAFGDLKHAVIEHHSNFDSDEYNKEELEKHDLAVENWDAPIIVTTNVQFFESLFSHRPSACRKLHNIMNSVVILDEAQALPVNLLQPCLEALRELTEHYKTTVVLCTATQPALEWREDFKTGLENVREIIKDRESLYTSLKRVDVKKLDNKLSDEELADEIKKHDQVLCVVNTRGHARKIFDELKKNNAENLFHLSANMCPQHRSYTLDKIRIELKYGMPCKVISTQVIEAGVDIDFPVVYRAIAGIDSIAQAAGRCNRENRLAPERGKVYVFETEKLPPGFLRQAADKGQETIRKCKKENWDVLSLEAIHSYFELYYWAQEDAEGSGLDKKKILEKLSRQLRELNFPFREISALFQLIEERGYLPVIVPFDDKCQKLVDELRKPDFSDWKLLRKLQRYTVSIPKREHNAIHHNLESLYERYFILINDSLYDEELGLRTDDPTYMKAENQIG